MAETRLCPVCRRSVQPRRTSIPCHVDSTGRTMCPGSGEPFSITLPDMTGEVSL